MQTEIEQGYLVIGDISGYTSFMADAELEYSPQIMSELLTLVLTHFTPRMILCEVEGDALFIYGSAQHLERGETLLEMIEQAYVAFHDHLDSMQRSTACGCHACQKIPRLDLKFIVHYGDYAQQSVAGRRKLVGSNVNLVHRLLKNSVAEATGWSAYALFTREALESMKIHPVKMYASKESYDHLGEIEAYSLNLDDRYNELVGQRSIVVEESDAHMIYNYQFPFPPETMWEWLNNPERRNLWLDGTTWSVKDRPDGRTGPGTIVHCAYNGREAMEKILDWRPFSYLTCEGTEGPFRYRVTTRLVPTDGGGCRAQILFQLTRPNAQGIFRGIGTFFFARLAKLDKGYRKLQELVNTTPVHLPGEEAVAGP